MTIDRTAFAACFPAHANIDVSDDAATGWAFWDGFEATTTINPGSLNLVTTTIRFGVQGVELSLSSVNSSTVERAIRRARREAARTLQDWARPVDVEGR